MYDIILKVIIISWRHHAIIKSMETDVLEPSNTVLHIKRGYIKGILVQPCVSTVIIAYGIALQVHGTRIFLYIGYWTLNKYYYYVLGFS